MEDIKVQALLEIEGLVDKGRTVRDAVAEVAAKTGFGARTLFRWRKATDFVARSEWGSVLAHKGHPARRNKMKSSCHPEALSRFIELCRSGKAHSESYRQVVAEAKANEWTPIPSERTLQRELYRRVSREEMRRSRRDAQPTGGALTNV